MYILDRDKFQDSMILLLQYIDFIGHIKYTFFKWFRKLKFHKHISFFKSNFRWQFCTIIYYLFEKVLILYTYSKKEKKNVEHRIYLNIGDLCIIYRFWKNRVISSCLQVVSKILLYRKIHMYNRKHTRAEWSLCCFCVKIIQNYLLSN